METLVEGTLELLIYTPICICILDNLQYCSSSNQYKKHYVYPYENLRVNH
jgi:hypothetical protein